MLVCLQSLNMVPRQNLHISLVRLFAPFGSPGKYFLKSAHPRRFECVVSLHTLQGSFFLSPGVFLPLGVNLNVFLPEPLSLGLFLFLVLFWGLFSLTFVALLLACGGLDSF